MEKRPMPQRGAPFLEWALWYAEVLGWAVFPCKPARKDPLFKSAHRPGDRCRGECGQVGHGVYDATTDSTVITAWWTEYPTANIGFALPANLVGVDVDGRNNGTETLRELEASYSELPRTVTNLTGSGAGSMHLIFQTDANTQYLRGTLGPGIDLKKQGGYLIVSPSIHPVTLQRYEWESDFSPEDRAPHPLPEWMLALAANGKNELPAENGVPLDPLAVIPEGKREAMLMRIAGAMQRVGAAPDEIYAALGAANNRCVPPLEVSALQRMADSVQRYDVEPEPATAVIGGVPAGWSHANTGTHDAQPLAPPARLPPWSERLFCFKNGERKQNVTNFKLTFQNHTHWQLPEHQLWWDTVRVRPMTGDADIDDSMILDTADWFGQEMNLPVTHTDLLQKTIISECKKHKRDLLREWVDALPAWDGKPRIETWLQDYAGVEDSAYSRDVSRVILVSMIARVMHPGCHYRFVAIMQGEEDIGKSLLIKALCGARWYVDLGLNLESKEAHMMLQGVWVAELGELHSMGNTEITRLKSFITMDEDSYIPKYGNLRETTERRAIFIGTTNQDVFLKDTGNTRFLPIKLHGECDRIGFEKVRLQLFAQARQYYGAHPEDWWDLSQEGHVLAQEERELRRLVNPYETKLHEWLEYERWNTVYYTDSLDSHGKQVTVTFTPNETSWPEIAQWCLGMAKPADWKDRSLQMQIASALRAIGWRVGQSWRFGRNMKVWRKEDTTPF